MDGRRCDHLQIRCEPTAQLHPAHRAERTLRMMRVISPLRYPGSKVRITEMVAGLLELNVLTGSHLYEPFAGGSAVSLSLLANGFVPSATWVERDPMIYAFWRAVKEQPDQLIERMMRGKVSLPAWRRMLPMRDVKRPT